MKTNKLFSLLCLGVLNVGIVIFLFYYFSDLNQRTNFFYFQLYYSNFLCLLFWSYVIGNSTKNANNEEERIISLISSSHIIIYIFISVLGAIFFTYNTLHSATYDKLYYGTIIIFSFLYLTIIIMTKIQIGSDENNCKISENKRQNIRDLSFILEKSELRIKELLNKPDIDKNDLNKIYKKLTMIILSLKNKTVMKGKEKFISELNNEIENFQKKLNDKLSNEKFSIEDIRILDSNIDLMNSILKNI